MNFLSNIFTKTQFTVVFPIVSSGAALIFAASLAATSSLSALPPLAAGGLGLLGLGNLSSEGCVFNLIHRLGVTDGVSGTCELCDQGRTVLRDCHS